MNIWDNIREKRLPWRIRSRLDKLRYAYRFYANFTRNGLPLGEHRRSSRLIVMRCGFHGRTGGPIAISAIANLLAKRYTVDFVSFPMSYYNSLLDYDVRLVRRDHFDGDLYICDVSCSSDYLSKLRNMGKYLIVTCHGLPDTAHGLTPQRVACSLGYGNLIHFVSHLQQKSFMVEDSACVVIPNTNRRVPKNKETRNVGIIGDIRHPRKRIAEAIDVAIRSDAEKIHVWGSEGPKGDGRVIFHDWERDKSKIYNSFDVLLSLSEEETFGLIVIEAMSAGIACVVSDIQAFRQFEKVKAVALVRSGADPVVELNRYLKARDALRQEAYSFWEANFSENIIAEKWYGLIDRIVLDKAGR